MYIFKEYDGINILIDTGIIYGLNVCCVVVVVVVAVVVV